MKNALTKYNNSLFFTLLALLVLAVYWPSLTVTFLSDDFSIIGKFLERKTFYFSFADFFRPLPLLDLWIDTQVFGLNPALFRLSNFAIHTVNAFLVYRLALLLLDNKQAHLAYISGLLFAVLACHSEAVIWISCRPDLLATLFSLVCLITYLNWLRNKNNIYLIISSLTFFFAFLSKESAYALPLLLIVFTCFHEMPSTTLRNIKKYRVALLLFVSALLLQFVLRFLATGAVLGGETSLVNSTSPYLYNLFAYSYRVLLFPTSTAIDAASIAGQSVFISIIVLMVITIGLWKADVLSRKIALFMLAAFVAALLPVLHKTISLFDLQMERYLYLPSVFICIFIAVFINVIPVRKIQYLIILIYVAVMTLFLNTSIERWHKASNIIVNSLNEIKENFHSQKLFVIGLPDNYKGVPVFRNGFPRAVMFFNQTPIRRKFIYMPAILEVNDDNVKINIEHNTEGFHASIDSTTSRLFPGEDIGAYNLLTNRENDITIQYPEINNSDYQVMFFEDGQLRFRNN